MGSRFVWVNSDGLTEVGGTRTPEGDSAAKHSTNNAVQEISVVLLEGDTAQSSLGLVSGATIPAGAVVVDVELHSDGALTSLVDLVVGVADHDGGSDITDADGLVLAIDAAEVVALRPTGTVVGTAFDGAILTASAPLAEAAAITISATAASTAGDVTAVIKYI